jgi:integrase
MDVRALTLCSFYNDRFLLLFHADASTSTRAEYGYSLKKRETITSNPKLEDLDAITLAEFRAKLLADLSPATANKHFRHLNHIFAKAGPPGPRNRDAIDVLDHCLWLQQKSIQKTLPRFLSMQQIASLYNAAPDDWWKALICCAYNLGYRRSTLLGTAAELVDLKERTWSVEDGGILCRQRLGGVLKHYYRAAA